MNARRPLGALPVVFLLCACMAHGWAAESPARAPWSQAVLGAGYFQFFPLAANVTAVAFDLTSNATVAAMVMSADQFATFNDTGAASWLYGQNGTDIRHAMDLAAGAEHYAVILAGSGPASVSYSLQTYSFGALPSPQSTGIASYGLFNESGVLSAYRLGAPEVAGTADISALEAYNGTAGDVNASVYGASLQLNSVLAITDENGSVESYWCQDVPDLATNSSETYFISNIWNDTVVGGSLSNHTVTSSDGGTVFASTLQGNTTYLYGNASPTYAYRLPFGLALIMNETLVPGTGVEVGFGVQVTKNGSLSSSPVDWFDHATLHDPGAASAEFYVSGDEATGSNNYYDAELVFGGEANGESTSFAAMNATLGLYYGNGTSFVPFPSIYSVGGDTQEAADNLRVAYSPGSLPRVTVGTPDYGYLGNFTEPPDIQGLTRTSSSSSTSVAPEFPAGALGAVVFASFAVATVATRLAARRGGPAS